MTHQEMETFLSEPHIADLATVRPDGSPHVAPVWHHYDGKNVYVVTEESAVKVRNIRHEPRVSLSIATDGRPYKYVLVNGTATISHDKIPELVRTMAINYLGLEEGVRYTEKVLKELRFCVITVTPSKLIRWSSED